MPKLITDQQVRRYRNNRKKGLTQVRAADKAGISERRGRDIEKNMRILKKERKQREKKNLIDKVFESKIVLLLKEHPGYQASFLLEHIQTMFSEEEYPDSLLRTLQRRMKGWKESNDQYKDPEIIFPQEHMPGILAACDFTHPKDKVRVTINGKPFKHKIFHVRLTYSGLSYAQVFEGTGESFEKLSQGLNEGFNYFGGVPEKLRTDSLSAAFKNLTKSEEEDVRKYYDALMKHYGIEAARINKGTPHENGSIESPHGHLKEYLSQSLALRGRSDFASIEEYRSFVFSIIEKRNRHLNKNLVATDKAALKPLPSVKAIEYTEVSAKVATASMIRVKNAIYSVPNYLIQKTLLVRIYSSRLECYLGCDARLQSRAVSSL